MADTSEHDASEAELPAQMDQLGLLAPNWVKTPAQRILWALWMTGGSQCFCNLALLTELDDAVLEETIAELNGKRVRVEHPPDSTKNDPQTLVVLL